MKDNDELWIGFIKRDIPKWEEYDIPENPESWYEVYCDLRERVQREVDKDAEQLKQAMEGINSKRAQHSTKLVTDQRSVRLPPMKPTERARYAAYDRKIGGIKPVFSSPSSGVSADPMGGPAWSFERPQIPRSFSGDGKKKNSIFSAPKRNKALAVPTGQLHNRASQVKMAPRSLVEAHRQPSEPALAARKASPTSKAHPALRAPGRTRSQPGFGSSNPVITPSLQEREARLRALTSGKPVSSPASRTQTPSASSRTPAQKSTPATRGPSPPLPAKREVDDLFESSPEPEPQDNQQDPKRKAPKRASPEPTLNVGESKTLPAQAPRFATIRKRPAPSIFMPPKRKKVT